MARPRSADPKTYYLKMRLTPDERLTFEECAEISGIPMAAWIRQRVRKAAVRELEGAGRAVTFLRTPRKKPEQASIPIDGAHQVKPPVCSSPAATQAPVNATT